MINWYKADTLPTTPTESDDGVWFIKKGRDFFDVYIISEGVIKSLDIEVPTDAIPTPTLAEVLAEGNNVGDEVIKFEWEIEGSPPLESLIYEIGKDSTTDAFSIRDLLSNKRIDFLGQFDPTGLDLYRGKDNVESDVYEYWEIGYNGSNNSRGLVGSEYFGANYNDNTYVQKRYVDNVVFNYALKKPTIEGTSGQVLTADRFGSYAWKDAVDWSNLTDKKHLRYDSSLGKPVDSNTSDTTTGIAVDGDVHGKGFIGKSVTASVGGSYVIDFDDMAEHYILTMTDNTSIMFDNMITEDETVVITLTVTGNYSLLLPSFLVASFENDDYDGSMNNEIVINIKRGGANPLGYYTLKSYEI